MKDYCAENEKNASDIFGSAFLTVPRFILDQLFSENLPVRQGGWLYLLLFAGCFYADGHVRLNDRMVSCRKGEFVGTQAQLARLSGINVSTVNRLLRQMADKKLITMNRIPGGTRIRVNGYVNCTAAPEKPKVEENTLADQLKAAKKQFGGRQMDDDVPTC